MDPSCLTNCSIDSVFWEEFDPLSAEKSLNQMIFEQPQKEFNIPNQVGAATWGMNQTSPNRLPQVAFAQPTTNNGVKNTTHVDPNHFQSVVPRLFNNGGKMPGTTQNKEKKKETDKKYRSGLKEKQKKIEADISALSKENALLKKENTSLIEITTRTNKSLQSAIDEKKKLEEDISKLNHDIKNLQKYFDLYSKRLVNSKHVDHQAELIQLKNTISILRENSNRDIWMTEKQKFEDEIARLEHQNKVLKVQVEVLSEMKTDKDFEEKQA